MYIVSYDSEDRIRSILQHKEKDLFLSHCTNKQQMKQNCAIGY